MTLFDAYLMVDWTASSKPKLGKDSIWLAVAVRTGDELKLEAPVNLSTRSAAEARVRELLRAMLARELRVLVGFDFPYGYPKGFAAAVGSPGELAPWRENWNRLSRAVRDDARNQNNRFEVAADLNAKLGPSPGPFWGCPAIRQTEALRSTACPFPYAGANRAPLERRRTAEQRLRGVQEVWKLYGNGSVGSQALVGIPRVAALRDDEALASVSRVWPFETGFSDCPTPVRGPFALHAEIWPGIVPIDPSQHAIRDAAQVLTLVRHVAALDDRGDLGALFRVPSPLEPADLAACIAEEGWILGA